MTRNQIPYRMPSRLVDDSGHEAGAVISRHRDGDVAVIEIDRHERRNALDAAHCHALRDAVQAEGARVIVITGAGSSFCSGADLGAVYDAAFRDALYAMLTAVTEAPVPVLAAVNGPAIGAGASWRSRATCASRPGKRRSRSRPRVSASR